MKDLPENMAQCIDWYDTLDNGILFSVSIFFRDCQLYSSRNYILKQDPDVTEDNVLIWTGNSEIRKLYAI